MRITADIDPKDAEILVPQRIGSSAVAPPSSTPEGSSSGSTPPGDKAVDSSEKEKKEELKKARLEEAKRQRDAERQRQKDDPICKGKKWLQGLAKDITAATTAKAESTTSSLPGNIGAEFQELFSRHTLTGNHSRVFCVLRGFLCACFAGLRIYEHVSGAVFLGVDSEPARNIAQDSTIESFQEPD